MPTISCAFAPVLDLNWNRFNNITGYRCIGENPAKAIPLFKQMVKGMQANGLAAVGKHFPGHGVDHRNSHLVSTINSLSWKEWSQNYGAVFQALIDARIHAIMTRHIALPAYTKAAENRTNLPCALSREITTELLKARVDFKGVVISDALIIGEFLKWGRIEKLEVERFKAGTDMLLWPSAARLLHTTKSEMELREIQVTTRSDLTIDDLEKTAADYDLIISALHNAIQTRDFDYPAPSQTT